MRVLFVASEAAPFVKSGGLGEVIGSLPVALRKLGIDARLIIPKYSAITSEYASSIRHLKHFNIGLSWRNLYCGIEEYADASVPAYFIDNNFYFGRNYMYGYGDQEIERYAYFCKAVLESIAYIDFKPDILHCHDWQTGLLPFMLKTQYNSGDLKDVKTLFTIHNLKYQGLFPKRLMGDVIGAGDEYFTSDKLEFHGNVNSLKAGLVYSDYISTVSPSYAEEIKNPYFGEGLDGLLRAKGSKLIGILNGADYESYNPETDKMLFENYDEINCLEGKAINKRELQKSLGLPVKPDIPILSIISRFVSQKGFDLVTSVLSELLELDIQMVLHGSGDSVYENEFKYAAGKFPDKLSVNIGYDDRLAHRIYAGSDMFLMPSAYEPCGLGQIFSLRYGTIPIVRETGGLKDTIIPYNEYTNMGNGFSFTNYNAHDMLFTVKRAISFYVQQRLWKMLIVRAMQSDFSWDRSAEKYVEIYKNMLL